MLGQNVSQTSNIIIPRASRYNNVPITYILHYQIFILFFSINVNLFVSLIII